MNNFTTWAAAAFGGLVLTILAIAAPGGVIGAGVIYATATLAFVIGAPLAIGGGIAALRYYNRIVSDTKRDFNERIDQVEKSYHTALNDLTQKERNRLTQYGKQVLTPIFSRLDVLAQRYTAQQNTFRQHQEQITTLRKGIEESQ